MIRLTISRGIVSLCVLSASLAACDKDQDEHKSQEQARTEREFHRIAWSESKRYEYEVSLRTQVAFSGVPAGVVELKGRMGVEARRRPGGWELGLDARQMKFVAQEGTTAQQFHEFDAQLANARYSAVLEKGRLESHRGDPTLEATVRNALLTLVSQFQVSDDAAKSPDELRGIDSSGRYVYSYEPSSNTDWIRKKELYEEVFLRGKQRVEQLAKGPGLDVERAAAKLTFRDGILVSLSSDEVVNSKLENSAAIRGVTRLTMKLVKTSEPRIDWQKRQEEAEALPLSAFTPGEVRARFDEKRIGDFTYESALAELIRLEKEKEQDEKLVGSTNGVPSDPALVKRTRERLSKYQSAFGAMVAILRTQPDKLERADRDLAKQGIAFNPLIDAVSSTGTPAAQKIVQKRVVDPKLELLKRVQAATGIARVERATPETIDALASLIGHSELRQFGSYGVGTASRLLSEAGDEEGSVRAFSILKNHLAQATSPTEQANLLLGMSNSARPELVQVAQPYLSHASERVRHAAIQSLRLVDGPRAAEIFVTVLKSESYHDRRIAIESLENRQATRELTSVLVQLAETSKRSAERLASVKILARWRKDSVAAQDALIRIAKNDEREVIRTAAQQALRSSG